MIAAAEMGHASTVEILLTHGANPALENKAGKTAADVAKRAGGERAAAVIEVIKRFRQELRRHRHQR